MRVQPFLIDFRLGPLISFLLVLFVGLLSLRVVFCDVVFVGVVVELSSWSVLSVASVFSPDLGPMVSGDQCWNSNFMPVALSMTAFACLPS